jgi:hypothetical protein
MTTACSCSLQNHQWLLVANLPRATVLARVTWCSCAACTDGQVLVHSDIEWMYTSLDLKLISGQTVCASRQRQSLFAKMHAILTLHLA